MRVRAEFIWGTNAESFDGDVHPTREEALDEGRATMPGRRIWTGAVVRYSAAELCEAIDADDVLNGIACYAEDVIGDVAEGWTKCSKEEEAKLTEAVHAVVSEWAVRVLGEPTFFSVQEIEDHDPEESEPLPEPRSPQ